MNTHIITALVAFSLGGLVATKYQQSLCKAEISSVAEAQAKVSAEVSRKALEAAKQRIEGLEVVANESRIEIEAAQADAATARSAAISLRKQLADYRNRVSCDSSAPVGGEAAEDALFLLTDLLSRADDRAGELAEFADQAHLAGRACEAAYNAVRSVN